jgi:hypothetical protein
VNAVTKLNELTRQQEIKWRQCAPPAEPSRRVSSFFQTLEPQRSYETEHDGRRLRITQYHGESAFGSGIDRYVLEVMDPDGDVTFEFPEVAGTEDLFSSIRRQKIDIESFIKRLAST